MSNTLVYFKHGLGNLVMMSPAIAALASIDESKKVDVILDARWNDPRRTAIDDVFASWDLVNTVYNYPTDKPKKKYGRYFYTGHCEHSAALDYVQGVSKLTLGIPDWKAESLHEAVYYMRLARLLGYRGGTPPMCFPVADGPGFEKGRLYVGVCNGTYDKNMKGAKQWPHFADLVRVLKRYLDCVTVKIGYLDELSDVPCDIDYVGKLSMTQAAKVISQLDLFITTDTANMHVADALGTKTLAIFGGSLVSKNGPMGKHVRVVRLGLACQPCQRSTLFYNCATNDCMDKLTVGDVMHHVRTIL